MAQHGAKLEGKRILVVEDELMLALEVERLLGELACEVVGSVGSVRKALATLEVAAVDGAVLDVHLRDGFVYPVTSVLSTRNIPYLFVTGYDADVLPLEVRNRPRLRKPLESRSFQRLAHEVFADGAGPV